jgi:hypothetical protein
MIYALQHKAYINTQDQDHNHKTYIHTYPCWTKAKTTTKNQELIDLLAPKDRLKAVSNMCRDFRNGISQQPVRVGIGKRTIKDEEAAVIWNVNGVSCEVVGPHLVRLFYSNVQCVLPQPSNCNS